MNRLSTKDSVGPGNEYGCGHNKNDWTQDWAVKIEKCDEEGCEISNGESFWVKDGRTLCADCITMVLNAREDYIADLKKEIAELIPHKR